MPIETIPQLFGSIAGKASGLGVKMHNAAYAASDINATYIAHGTDDVRAVLESARTLGFGGLGISMPFKEDVISLLDEVGRDVKAIGACNTVHISDGRLVGHNTDWVGAVRALTEVTDLSSAGSALVVGAGGAARAIAYGLKDAGLDVTVAARRVDAARRLKEDLDLAGFAPLPDTDGRYQVVVNATPDATLSGPVTDAMLEHATALLDVVFTELETDLASHARRLGLAVAPGWRMLLHQGARQFEIYTGQEAPVAAMAQVLELAFA